MSGVRGVRGVDVPTPCPRCAAGVVTVREATWESSLGPRKSVWVDEPAHCAGPSPWVGCALTAAQVERLLVSVYEAPAGAPGLARQLPLFALPDAGEEAA